MDATVMLQFLNQWLGLIIDTGLVLGFFFLWLSWHRNGKRQQQLEQLLGETARQLEEATRHLSEATAAIKHLKQQEQRRPAPVKQARRTEQPPVKQTLVTPPAQNSTQATMILRMKREGESPQTIAERLDMPLAQVKLLLKLHAASSSVS
jgi:DNA-directed RNA polymerase specialized sigma24 family protein